MTIMDQYFELIQSDCIWQQQKNKNCFLGFCELCMAGPTPKKKKNIFAEFLQSTSTNNQLTKYIQMYSFEVFQRFMVMPVILFENSKFFLPPIHCFGVFFLCFMHITLSWISLRWRMVMRLTQCFTKLEAGTGALNFKQRG